LNDASYRLLNELLTVPGDFRSIAAAFAPDECGVESDRYLDSMASMLDRLEHLGLVEQV